MLKGACGIESKISFANLFYRIAIEDRRSQIQC